MRKLVMVLITSACSVLLPSSPSAFTWHNGGDKGIGPVLLSLDLEAHDVNDVYLMVSNRGPIGLDIQTGNGTGYFPSSTSNNYIFGTGLLFGANYDADDDGDLDKVYTQGFNSLAGDSEFREGRGDQNPNDPLTRVFDSTDPSDLAEWPPQFSDPWTGEPIVYTDQDLVTTYTTKDKLPNFGSFQLPLEVNQRTMAVTSPDSVDQVIFAIFEAVNTGDKVLEDAWIGFDSDMDVGQEFTDDLTSVIFDWITPEGDTIKLDTGYAWDSNFYESSFVGDPGFVGVTLLYGPGIPNDGIDNDGDGLVDESRFNGLDDDDDGQVDEWDEVDEIGLTNYSKHCNPSIPCGLEDPQTDEEGYDLLSCDTQGSSINCFESTGSADIRFMLSSGPFDWLPGQTYTVAFAFVFSNSVGSPNELDFYGDPPRPDPNDPALSEFVRIAEMARELFRLKAKSILLGD